MSSAPGRPLVIEIIGPAGTGKSTIADALAERSNEVLVASPPDPRSWRSLPFYARHLVASLPVLAQMGLPAVREGYRFRAPIASVVVLNSWDTKLVQKTPDRCGLIILDQGPLYLLAELYGRGPIGLLGQTQWWDQMYRRYAQALDCVVRLDADDTLLIPRIRERAGHHRVKQMTDSEGRRFLARWRGSLNYTLARLVDHSRSLRVLSYDTSSCSPEVLVDVLLQEIYAP